MFWRMVTLILFTLLNKTYSKLFRFNTNPVFNKYEICHWKQGSVTHKIKGEKDSV
jgi:hypothetical protein